MPFWRIIYFELTLHMKQLVQEQHFDPPLYS